MSTVRFTCPYCRVTVCSKAYEEQDGRRAVCPECDTSFVVRKPVSAGPPLQNGNESNDPKTMREGIQSAESITAPARTSGPLEKVGTRQDASGRKRRIRKQPASATPWPLIVGLSVGAIVLVAGAVVGAALFWHSADSSELNERQQAQRQAPVPDKNDPAKNNDPVPPPDNPVKKPPLNPNLPADLPSEVAWNPVPQESPEKAKARRNAKREWVKATTLDAYERVGRKGPKWDAPARESLEAVIRLWCGNTQGVGHDRVACWQAADRAVKAGCDDPLIKYLHARMGYNLRSVTPQEESRELDLAADALAESEYPAVRKAHGHHNAAAWLSNLKLTPMRKAAIEEHLSATLDLIPEILQEDHPQARRQALHLCGKLADRYTFLLGDRKKGIDRITAVLEGDPAWEPLLLCFRGESYITYAWDARGTGFANTVTPEGWRLFFSRLRQAEKDLTNAWEMDNSLYQAANGMITVAMGLGWKHEQMEVWFERAMKVNSDNLDACSLKLNYLLPRWHGSVGEILAFGRGCRDTKNWEGGLPFVLSAAHFEAGGRQPKNPYFRQPGVWAEIQPLFQTYLKLHPEADFYRASYGLWAYRCGRYQKANEIFQQLDDDDWVDVFASSAHYRQIVADTRRRAGDED